MENLKQLFKVILIGLNKHSRGILALCAVMTLLFLTIPSCFQKNKQGDEVYGSKKPDIKIKSVFYKSQIYPDSPTTQSEALNFFIPIRNEGDGTAYDVQIKKKTLTLVRGQFDLNTPSLKTAFTSTFFDLPPRQIIMDGIFIDENPAYMHKVMSGEKSITLEYEIRYYKDKVKRDEPFVYKYKNTTVKGEFQDDGAEKSLAQQLKP